MSRPEARAWARLAVRIATDLIPPGTARDRYRAELESELWGRTPWQQAGSALSILMGAPALHRALVETHAIEFAHSPLWCRARLHHRWHRTTTEDNVAYRRCLACGLDDDGLGRSASSSMGAVIAFGRPTQ